MKPHCLLLALSLLAAGCSRSDLPPGARPLPPPASTSPVARESGLPLPAPSGAASSSPSAAPSAAAAVEWHTFTAKDGSFTVDVPGRFEEDRGSIRVHRFTTSPLQAGATYDVSIVDIQEGDRSVPRGVLVHSLVEGLVKSSPRVLKREQTRFKHVYPVERAVFKTSDGGTVLAQVFATDKYLWVMQITIPASMRDARDVNISRFMDSITVQDKPAFEAADKLPPNALPSARPSAGPR